MNDIRLEQIKERCNRATGGPWISYIEDRDHTCGSNFIKTAGNDIEFDTNKDIKGTITFISPESYPACLWIGKRITMYEGKNIVGYVTITKIFNKTVYELFEAMDNAVTEVTFDELFSDIEHP